MSTRADEAQFDRPLVEVTVSAPADEVWQALRDPATLQQWFGWDADTLAAEIQYIFHDHAVADDAARVLRFEGISDRFEVVTRGDATVIRVVRAAPTADTDWDEVFEDMTQGWIAFTRQLAFALQHHRGQTRRTLYFSGSPTGGSGVLAGPALGLSRTWTPGQTYAIAAPFGEQLAGEVWHRGRHQIGVTVRGWGDGLLVVMDRPPTERAPRGGSQMILTTYGLDDAAFAALSARWSSWWAEHFGPSDQPACA